MIIGDEVFKLKGQRLLDPGFVSVMPWQRHGDTEVPDLYEGQVVRIKGTRITEHVTEPPGYLTEADLIEKMEKYGIGTDASIPTHINNIIERAYVQVEEPGRKLIPTPIGYALAKGYCEIDPELVLPQVRGNIEKSCEMIAKGRADFNRVTSHVLEIFKKKLHYFKLSAGTMERILTIMLNTAAGDKNLQCLSNKIKWTAESLNDGINFCHKCFKGHFLIDYNSKKGWGLKC